MWMWRDWRGVRGEARVVERRAERKRRVGVVVFMLKREYQVCLIINERPALN